jgi:diguanylate cyclase (GGDEF)-like protein/PAS domain S-box-containing protein
MQPTTALSFVVLGAALLAKRADWSVAMAASAATVIAISGLTLLEHALDTDLGIERVLRVPRFPPDDSHAGRMGAYTALCFLLLATAVVSTALLRRRRARYTVAILSLTVLSVASWILLAYATSPFAYNASWRLAQMGTHSAFGLVFTAIAMLVAALAEAPERGRLRGLRFERALPLRPGRTAWTALAVCMTLTAAAWYATALRVQEHARGLFSLQALEMESELFTRLHDYQQVLFGARGFFVSSLHVTQQEWQNFFRVQDLAKRLPGVLNVGFAPRIRGAELQAHIQSTRATGQPDYTVHPSSPRDEYYPVVYLEPISGPNHFVLGYDNFSDPDRREAMERARDTGALEATGAVIPLQDSGAARRSVTILFLAIYKESGMPATLEARRESLVGFISCPFNVQEFVSAAIEARNSELSLRISEALGSNANVLIFDRDGSLSDAERGYDPMFEVERKISLGGRTCFLQFRARPAFNEGLPYGQPIAVIAGGTLFSILIFGITWSLSSSRLRAHRIARLITLKLRDSERRYRELVDQSQGLICLHGLDGRLLYVNPAAASVLGYEIDELLGRNLAEILDPDARDELPEYLAAVRTHGRLSGTMRVRTSGGARRIWQYNNSYQESLRGNYVLGHAQDVTALHEAQKALEDAHEAMREMATHDSLTGLANRHLLHEHLAHEIEQGGRTGRKAAVLYIDLDGFKQVNDTLGHGVGDTLLQQVAEAIKCCCRSSDIPARLGGDEFAVLLTNVEGASDCGRVAEKIAASVRQVAASVAPDVGATASIGIAVFTGNGATPEELIQRADASMYRAKQEGGDRHRVTGS